MKPLDTAQSPSEESCPLSRPQPSEPHGEQDQGEGARIYGKEGCPHTDRARAALPRASFVDVQADAEALEEMLRLSGGVRRVPVIARGDAVEVGFRRGS